MGVVNRYVSARVFAIYPSTVLQGNKLQLVPWKWYAYNFIPIPLLPDGRPPEGSLNFNVRFIDSITITAIAVAYTLLSYLAL